MSKHTPGPWQIMDESRCRYAVNTADAENIHIAMVNWGSLTFHGKEEQPLANARLIAAAPDMYEALQTVLGWYSGPTDVEDMIRKALRKAEGR